MEEDSLRKIIHKSIKDLQEKGELGKFEIPEISLEHPKKDNYGDTSTPVSSVIGRITGKNPFEIAQKISKEIQSYHISSIQESTVARPVFNNFYFSKDSFVKTLKKIDKDFGRNKNLKNKKVVIEYTDPNILKEFHIGHLMPNTIGESISRIIEFQGAKVKRLCYQGDVGLHIAKAIFGKLKDEHKSWQEAYVLGSKLYEENIEAKSSIDQINKKIYERSDNIINNLYDKGKQWSLNTFGEIYKKLGTTFDYLFFESQTAEFGKKIVERGLKKGLFETGDKGAIVFKGEKYGLHTRVFINSQGLPTYEAKELGLAKIKYDKYRYDQSVIITANEQNEYFKVVLSAMIDMFPNLAKKTKHIGHGMMRLPEGKMSSRTGKIVTFEFLLNEVENLVKEKIKDRDLSDTEKKEIIEKVAIGALKYSILKQSIGSDIIYDFEKSISFEGDSGPYLQYSYARAQSVLRKAKKERIKPSFKKVPNEISQLEKNMTYFRETVEKAGKEYEPHFIVLYLTELAREFNNYYAKNKIVDKADEFSPYKVVLAEAFSIIMKNGLWLLGIQAPEKM